MDSPLNHVFFPDSFSELFAVWNRFPAAVPYAGGTDQNIKKGRTGKSDNTANKQESSILNLPPAFICLDKIEELHIITRTEHYLEIGAMVKLNRLLQLGKTVPHILRKCLEKIAGVQLRNIATVGGNICTTSRLLDLPAPLTALDAQYEIRNAQTSRWVSSARFHSLSEATGLGNQEILSRIRLPLHQWDYSIYKKFFVEGINLNESLIFLARTQKNILSEIRIIYKGLTIIRNKECEAILNGKSLPLSRKTSDEFIEKWREFLSNRHEISEFSKNALKNSIEENVFNLSE